MSFVVCSVAAAAAAAAATATNCVRYTANSLQSACLCECCYSFTIMRPHSAQRHSDAIEMNQYYRIKRDEHTK